MNPLLLGPVFELGGKIIDRLFPDPAAKAAAELELLKLTQSGDLQTTLAQLEINAKEAAHPSLFVAGWRPFVGWTCGIGLVYATVGHNLLAWLAVTRGWPAPPAVDAELLIYTLGGLLGIGGLRTIEKVKGVSK
jgi:Holin of 3TMs, for gene-transfer release